MPKKPDPPWRVLATYCWFDPKAPRWWEWDSKRERFCECCQVNWVHKPDDMTPIDHPRNDPEALEIIKQAKEAK